MNDAIRYPCCHEAGHALVRVIIGDKLLRIHVDPVDPEHPFATPSGERGATIGRARERECACGKGSVKNNPESSDEEPRCTIAVNGNCNLCLDDLIRRLTVNVAGGICTKYVTPRYHQERDSQIDQRRIEELFSQMPNLESRKRLLVNQAKASAIDLVRRETKAIESLISALASAKNLTLDGNKAEGIIRSALVSSDFPPTAYSPRT